MRVERKNVRSSALGHYILELKRAKAQLQTTNN